MHNLIPVEPLPVRDLQQPGNQSGEPFVKTHTRPIDSNELPLNICYLR